MEKIVLKNLCTGCTSCVNICPKNAISMNVDNDGFKYPVIDNSRCINCGICQKSCPVINFKKNSSLNKCYVGYAIDKKAIEKTSSGGIFPLIADYVLDNNGIVIGAAFNDNNKLNHVAIAKKKDLDKLKGSKYLQSNLDNIFSYVKDNVKDHKILFVGTPCQVAGLKSFLKKNNDNLICIDLICHGVPTPKLFDKYVKELEEKYNDKLLDYNFRDKSTGWDTYSNTMSFKNRSFSELQKDNCYMKLFLSDIALRESCYSCNFKLGNKYSDITLGDFWGVNNHYPEMYNKKGVSAIIVNTELGNEYFNLIKNRLEYKECNLQDILLGNPSLQRSSMLPKNREKFFNDINNYDMNYLCNKYAKKASLIRRVKNRIKKIFNKKISK